MSIIVNKIKLKPNKAQEKFFELSSRSAIFVYNWALYQNSIAYSLRMRWINSYGSFAAKNKNGKIDHSILPENCKFISYYDLSKRLKYLLDNCDRLAWVKSSNANCRRVAINNADTAWKNYFSGKSKRGKEKDGGKPKRKKYHEYNYSFYAAVDTPSYPRKKVASKVIDKKIQLSKIGWVNMTRPLYYEGFVCGVVVSKHSDGWYAAISVKDSELRHKRRDIKKCGIDLGLKDLVTIHDGVDTEKYNIRDFVNIKKELKRIDKQISRKYEVANHGKKKNEKKFYSKNRKRLQVKSNNLKKRLSDIKEYDLHNISTDIVLNHKNIIVEDLDVVGLKAKTTKSNKTNRQKKSINSKYDDQNLGKFKIMLDYKSELYGSDLIKADRYFASSKICSSCGQKNTKLTVDVREWICDSCGVVHDRDENAAKNLFNYKK